ETLKAKGVYNKNKLFGVTTLDVIRAETFVGNLKDLNPANVHVPVIGGHSGTTILPLLSQVEGVTFTDEEVQSLTTRIQNAGTEVVEAKAGGGSATLSMGQAAARFCLSLVAAMRGDNVVEYTYVETNSDDAEFFSHPVRLGKNGVEEILSYGQLSDFEQKAKEAMLDGLRGDIKMGIEFVKN
ncbi:MAG: malate dehydrogenase, partial [Paraglaciecola sp.]